MDKLFAKINCKKGATVSIETMFWLFIALALLLSGLEVFRHQSRISDTKKIAQAMARQISLTGQVDGATYAYLEEIKNVYNMDVTMDVKGNFISGNKLQLESTFTVEITYKTDFTIGIIKMRKDMTYVTKAVGTSEKYH